MAKHPYNYLVRVQYLGFRYHGWQRQPNVKTVQEMIEKTLQYVFTAGEKFKILGASRTDAMVSAKNGAFQLFLDTQWDTVKLIKEINVNLPQDIRALDIVEIDSDFNIIHDVAWKEYHYQFTGGIKNHPFTAPYITGWPERLDIESMKKGASLYKGRHFFRPYCHKPKEDTSFERTIEKCEIIENVKENNEFLPDRYYTLKIRSSGFLKYQIRIMMGALFLLGEGKLSEKEIKQSLTGNAKIELIAAPAPASGLVLSHIEFKKA